MNEVIEDKHRLQEICQNTQMELETKVSIFKIFICHMSEYLLCWTILSYHAADTLILQEIKNWISRLFPSYGQHASYCSQNKR